MNRLLWVEAAVYLLEARYFEEMFTVYPLLRDFLLGVSLH